MGSFPLSPLRQSLLDSYLPRAASVFEQQTRLPDLPRTSKIGNDNLPGFGTELPLWLNSGTTKRDRRLFEVLWVEYCAALVISILSYLHVSN